MLSNFNDIFCIIPGNQIVIICQAKSIVWQILSVSFFIEIYWIQYIKSYINNKKQHVNDEYVAIKELIVMHIFVVNISLRNNNNNITLNHYQIRKTLSCIKFLCGLWLRDNKTLRALVNK